MDTAGIRLTPKEIVSKLNEYMRNQSKKFHLKIF